MNGCGPIDLSTGGRANLGGLMPRRRPVVGSWSFGAAVRLFVALGVSNGVTAIVGTAAPAQELGGAGTVQGTVKDPTGGVMQAVAVSLTNPVTGFKRDTTTDAMG